ncbi:uncharacterized protein LOC135840174 [Planococcus citri]|uniref:uncharacterized protein LOC135840174 n=1 Tax=Planococcus citri TaxID=170843 RepID=UPI0031F93B79
MDTQANKQRLQREILSEIKKRGIKNWAMTPKQRDDTNSRIDFKLATALSSSGREPLIEREIVQKVNEISLPEYKANEILQSVTRDLKAVFESNYVGLRNKRIVNEWELYGSFKNGLRCKDSDIDFHNGTFENLSHSDAVNLVEQVRDVFRNRPNTNFEYIIHFSTARVPIVVLKHRSSNTECGIAFTAKPGVYNSMLAKLYLDQYPDVKFLTLFLKHVLNRYELLGPNKITTHVIFWLVVFYMQQKKLLLPVKDVRQSATRKSYVRNWNYSVPDSYPKSRQAGYSSKESIASLYRGFLEFYKNFNFLKYVICPYFGYAIPIENLETLDIPSDAYIGGKPPKLFTRSSMNIQDMSTLTKNYTASIKSVKVVNEFRVICEHLFANCEEILKGHAVNISLGSELKSMKLLHKNINQTEYIDLEYQSLKSRVGDLKEYLIAAVGNVMAIALEFQSERLVSQDITEVDHNQGDPITKKIPVLYMDYSTTKEETLVNNYMLSMFEESSSLKKDFGIFFFIEIRQDLDRIRVHFEGDGRFVEFMNSYGKALLIAL